MVCGWAVHVMQVQWGWDAVRSYRIIFMAYAAIGLVKLALTSACSKRCEREDPPEPVAMAQEEDLEREPLLASSGGQTQTQTKPTTRRRQRSILPSISKEGRRTYLQLAILFSLDSFASGLASL